MNTNAPGIRVTAVQCEGTRAGSQWPLQTRVTGFSFNMKVGATDKMTLTMDNHDLHLFGHKAMQFGSSYDVRWGYAQDLSPPRRVYLEDFRGFTELEVTFSGHERPLNAQAKARTWTDTPVVQVVREVANDNGFDGAYLHLDDPGPSATFTAQASETDAALLQRLAAMHGMEFFVDATGLHWHRPRKADAPAFTASYQHANSRLLQLDFTSNLARHLGRVEVRGRDPLNRKPIVARVTKEADRLTLSETVEVIDPDRYETAQQQNNARAAVHPTAATTQAEAEQEANARYATSEGGAIEARAVVVGTPGLIARSIVRLEKVTPYLSGNYYANDVTHRISDGGYTTELRLTRDGGGTRVGQTVAPQGGQRNDKTQDTKPEPVEIIDADKYTSEVSR